MYNTRSKVACKKSVAAAVRKRKAPKENVVLVEEKEKGLFVKKFVWMGTIIGDKQIEDAERFFSDNLDGVRVKYLNTIVTLPGKGGNGGRHDAVFAVHVEDENKFAVRRFALFAENDVPIWWETYLCDYDSIIPPQNK